jgi:aspartate aminotransferase
MIQISNLVRSIPPSPTLAIDTKAKQLAASGVDVVSFGTGEPDFVTPRAICDAAILAMEKGQTKYTAVGGTPELKGAIRAYYHRRLGIEFPDAEIIASSGGKHSLYNLFLSLLNPGDEVILPAPFWVSYPVQIAMAGARAVTVAGDPEHNFMPAIEALEAAVTPKTRAIVINNPSNPTGAFWDRDQLQAIADWLKRHPQIVVISDAIYEALVYDGLEYVELLSLAPELRERYVLVSGSSKSFAMTGWRLGYTLAPANLVAAMTNLQSQSTSNPSSIVQAAAAEGLRRGEELIAPMRARFEKRRDLIVSLLRDIPGVRVPQPRGAFYAFPDVRGLLGRSYGGERIESDEALATLLLDRACVAVVPGTPFGAPGFIRLSYATSEARIEEGIRRIRETLGV